MKILILNWRSLHDPLSGGAEVSLFEQAKYWKMQKADVTWFSSTYTHALPEEQMDGITFIHKGSPYSVHLYAFWYFINGSFGKPDVVIDCFHGIPFFTPLYAKSTKVVALINEVAGKVWFENALFPTSFIGFCLEKLSFLFYKKTHFITGSQSGKDDVIKQGIPAENITIVPHGVTVLSVRDTVKKETGPTILFLGRLSSDKGIKDALIAFRYLHKTIPGVTLWIAGKEEKEGQLQQQIDNILMHEENAKSHITYYGFVSDEKKFALYRKAWVLMHPSHKEGWGLTVIEAASQGTPTVGYNVEGLRDSIIDEKTGLLSDPNPRSLAERITDLLNDKDQYRKIAMQAEQYAKEFSWGKAGQNSWRVLEKIVKEKE